jgi:hypothetical protein
MYNYLYGNHHIDITYFAAISTGLGAIPFYFFSEPDKFWMGISNGNLYIIVFMYIYLCIYHINVCICK